MGKPTGFMEYKREVSLSEDPKKRIRHFNEFTSICPGKSSSSRGPAAWSAAFLLPGGG